MKHEAQRGSSTRHRFGVAVGGSYFLLYAGGFFWTYMPRYLEALGWTGAAIGALFSARSLLKTVALPFWGQLTDRTGRGVLAVHMQLLLGAAALGALPFVERQWAIGLAIAAQAALAGATIPMLDALTLAKVGAVGFGRLRAWGSIGFGMLAAATAALGIWSTHGGLANLAPWGLALSWLLALVVSLGLPRRRASFSTAPSWAITLQLLARPSLIAMLPLAALHWMSIQPYHIFLVSLSEERGFGAWAPGVAVVSGIVIETIVFSLSATALRRARPTTLLLVSVIVTAGRWWLTGYTDNQWIMIVLQGLHGISFGFFYVAAMAILDRDVDDSIRATGQALFYLVVFGFGTAAGAFASGLVVDEYSASTLFRWAAYLEIGVFVLGLVLGPIISTKPSSPA